ncbi:site-2 protease family protein [Cohnella nanjingensis]|uniref:Site-2 protease family protein n=1 Tax=Cohnella nanjingensis TaxID=1387779 RepID=A0A7X0VIN0_9BACL|nr:site-2 protease family protein [Cohnella nanjingensis]MBB6675385.1 site-2 protease family protein [Cohnella nanjingensis]
MSFFWFPLAELPFVILTMLIAFTVHEYAHAWTAYKFGDTTAYEQGRVTLNPMAHIDLFGLLFLLVAGFGWAKPVPVRRSRFKRPRLMSIMVTAAGPVSNLLMAFIGLFLYFLMIKLHAFDHSDALYQTVSTFLIKYFVSINVTLFLFNLIPLPPLDGYRIVEEFASLRLRMKLVQYEQWGAFIFLLFIFLPPLRAVTLTPLFSLGNPIIEGMAEFFVRILGIGRTLLTA